MKRLTVLVLVLALGLCGCTSLLDGNYVSVEVHQEQKTPEQSGMASVSNYGELREALLQMVNAGSENSVIQASGYDQTMLEKGMSMAVDYVRNVYPVGAYAVEDIHYEIGASGGKSAVSVAISYIHGRSEIRNIVTVRDATAARDKVAEILEKCESSVVIRIKGYSDWDVVQFVESYAAQHPDVVIETPEVAVGMYPESGTDRVMELKFTYQNSRDSLRQMQSQVEPYFAAAELYVSGNGSEGQKYAQLYTFLMERYDYQIQTSLTPAYSLLCHGVGDCEAFARVYGAMCRQAGLECQVINGTKNGEPWSWNLICDNGVFYHVDLLESSAAGEFIKKTRDAMDGYVWDYSTYDPDQTN